MSEKCFYNNCGSYEVWRGEVKWSEVKWSAGREEKTNEMKEEVNNLVRLKRRINSKKKRWISSRRKSRFFFMTLLPFLRYKIKIRCERRCKRGLIGCDRNIACCSCSCCGTFFALYIIFIIIFFNFLFIKINNKTGK